MTDPLADLSAAGVSLWLDDLSRQRLQSGNLAELIETKHIVGVTTNPSIFAARPGQTASRTRSRSASSPPAAPASTTPSGP